MSDLSSRLGFEPPAPTRSKTEIAPPALRQILRTHLVDEYGTLQAYRQVAAYAEEVPESGIWGADWANPAMDRLLESMDWDLVYEALEAECPTGRFRDAFQKKVNRALARHGIAYEMSDGEFHIFDPEGEALGLELTNPVAGAGLETVRDQFQGALEAVIGIHPNARTAIREATNALEAFGRIRTGNPKASLKDAIKPLVGDTPSRKSLLASLTALYGYASTLPGARHGAHADEDVTLAEARYAVRVCGAALALLLEEKSGSSPVA